MITYKEEKKERINISISKRSLKTLQDNIPQNKRSAFIDFLINHYCEYEAGNFNRLFFSKKTAEILSRNNQKKATSENHSDDSLLSELISELNDHLSVLKSDFQDNRNQIEQIKSDFEELRNG